MVIRKKSIDNNFLGGSAMSAASTAQIDYISGVFSGSGRLGIFTREANLVKKNRSKQGVRMLIAAIADDSGPFPGGVHACDIAIDAVTDFFDEDFFTNLASARENPVIEDKIRKLVSDIGYNIFNRGKTEGAQVRLSLSILLLIENRMYAAHVGTNRIFKVYDVDNILQLSEDHSWSSQAMMQHGSLSQNIVQRDLRSINIPTLGLEQSVDIQFIMNTVKEGDRIILSSDGITEFVPSQEILVILNSVDTLQAACNRLVSISQERGMRDNGTLIAIGIAGEGEVAKQERLQSKDSDISGIVKRDEKKKKSFWNVLYTMILVILLAVLGAGGYVGYRYAQKLLYNLENPRGATRSSGGDVPLAGIGPVPVGTYYIAKDPDTIPMSIFKLNNRKLDFALNKYELTESFNTLEILPELTGGTYRLTLKINAKDRYRVHEGSLRNVIQLYENETKIYLTRGARALIANDESFGVMNIELSGLQSPVKVVFERQNVVFRISSD